MRRRIDRVPLLPLVGGLAAFVGFGLILTVVWAFPEGFRVGCISTIDHASHCRSSK